ncbi:Protein of unknown function [Cognatiyoonia koreensis]|uniref:YetF C-terminal domain-containing protein n=1 Tax=Cognatiyoonia koreensis TaxID=364200 RepID=A0A1I0MZA5_9RHOB|nr:YetF domain-containing protein [Cognatiyoonia koreensis]SEV94098.1 Protein of unknown function [Cognatiyoonia koreensis]
MFFESTTLDTIARAMLLSSVGVCWVILFVRIVGLRAFSKMTAFDFVITVAIGSLLAGASQASSWSAFAQASLGIGALLGVQYLVALLRRSSGSFRKLVQNTPIMLMKDGKMFPDALAKARVHEDDVIAKLREANVLDLSQVRAVVLETTGDISVLHGDALDDKLIDGVTH